MYFFLSNILSNTIEFYVKLSILKSTFSHIHCLYLLKFRPSPIFFNIALPQLLLTSLYSLLLTDFILDFLPLTRFSLILNILVRWNRTSRNLEIRVPVLGNRLFCAWWLIHFCWDIYQNLAASAVRSSLYQSISQQKLWFGMHKRGSKKWFPYHRTADIKPSEIFRYRTSLSIYPSYLLQLILDSYLPSFLLHH